jgi:hypothetical protein
LAGTETVSTSVSANEVADRHFTLPWHPACSFVRVSSRCATYVNVGLELLS